LDFAAGTYFLVLDGPAGPFSTNASWVGGAVTATLETGFTVGGGYFADGSPDAFAPASDFSEETFPLIFELSTPDAVAPEPVSLALLGLGLAGLGWSRRRK
jgi:hypothetical protein